jgi:hypothetical protein
MDFGSDYAFGTGAHRSCRFASAVVCPDHKQRGGCFRRHGYSQQHHWCPDHKQRGGCFRNVAVASAATVTASNTTNGNTATHRYRR